MIWMIYCCKEHAEFALEEVIIETGEPPKIEEVNVEKLPTSKCGYCGQTAEYIVAN